MLPGGDLPLSRFQFLLNQSDQINSRYSKCFSQFEDRGKRGTLFGSLKGADVAALRASTLSQLILRQALPQAKFLERLAKDSRR